MPKILELSNLNEIAFGEIPTGMIIGNYLYDKNTIQPLNNGFIDWHINTGPHYYNITSFVQRLFGGQLQLEIPFIIDVQNPNICYMYGMMTNTYWWFVFDTAKKEIIRSVSSSNLQPFMYIYHDENYIYWLGTTFNRISLSTFVNESLSTYNPFSLKDFNTLGWDTDVYKNKNILNMQFTPNKNIYAYYKKESSGKCHIIDTTDHFFFHFIFDPKADDINRFVLQKYYLAENVTFNPSVDVYTLHYTPSMELNNKLYYFCKTNKSYFDLNHNLDILEYDMLNKKFEEYQLYTEHNNLLNIPSTFYDTNNRMAEGKVNIIEKDNIRLIETNNIQLGKINLIEETPIVNKFFPIDGLYKHFFVGTTMWYITVTSSETGFVPNNTSSGSVNGWMSSTAQTPQILTITPPTQDRKPLIYGYVVWVKEEFRHHAPTKWKFVCGTYEHEVNNAEFFGDIPYVHEFPTPIAWSASVTNFKLEMYESASKHRIAVTYFGILQKPLKDKNPVMGLTTTSNTIMTTMYQNNGYDLKMLSIFPLSTLSQEERDSIYTVEPIEGTTFSRLVDVINTRTNNTNRLTRSGNISDINRVGFIYTINTPMDGVEAKYYKFASTYTATYMPKTWQLFGSNDKLEWSLLHDQSTNVSIVNQSQSTILCQITNPGKYKHYKLEITSIQGTGAYAICGGFHLLDDYSDNIISLAAAHISATHTVDDFQQIVQTGGSVVNYDETYVSTATKLMNYYNNTKSTVINGLGKQNAYYISGLIGEASRIMYSDHYSVQFQYAGRYNNNKLKGIPTKIVLLGLKQDWNAINQANPTAGHNVTLATSTQLLSNFEILDVQEIDNENYNFEEIVFKIKNPKTVKGYMLLVDGDDLKDACYIARWKMLMGTKNDISVFPNNNNSLIQTMSKNISGDVEKLFHNYKSSSQKVLDFYDTITIDENNFNDNYIIVSNLNKTMRLKSYSLKPSALYINNSPSEWKVYSSNDSVSWTEIDHVVDYHEWLADDNVFELDNVVNTKYLKFEFLAKANVPITHLPVFKDYLIINHTRVTPVDDTNPLTCYHSDLFVLDRTNKKAILADRLYRTFETVIFTGKDTFAGRVKNGFISYTVDYTTAKFNHLHSEIYEPTTYELNNLPYKDTKNNLWFVTQANYQQPSGSSYATVVLAVLPTYKTKKLIINMDQTDIPYEGTPINTNIKIRVVDQNGYFNTNQVYLEIIGNAMFTENSNKTITVNFNIEDDLQIPITLLGEDYITIKGLLL